MLKLAANDYKEIKSKAHISVANDDLIPQEGKRLSTDHDEHQRAIKNRGYNLDSKY
jgi:hypothetical protein